MTPRHASLAFSIIFNAYAKAANKTYRRTGSLFEDRFKRVEVTTDAYFTQLIFFHFNPQKHGFLDDFRRWPWSSYKALVGQAATRLARQEAPSWFGSAAECVRFHNGQVNEAFIRALISGDL